MDFTHFFNEDKDIKVGILGATKGYGYTVLSQIRRHENIKLRSISSRSFENCKNILIKTGFDENRIKECDCIEDINNSSEDDILIMTDPDLLLNSGITSFIECTGNVELGVDLSIKALEKGINVYMVSKEMDSVCGPYLNHLADEKGCVYSLVNGDQPRNAIDLYSWGLANGFEVVAIGKSSEYDFVWDRKSGDITYTDGSNQYKPLANLEDFWNFQDKTTLSERADLVRDYLSVISADLCEMNLVSNITGFAPASKHLNYPVLKVTEIPNVLIPEEDGGILKEEKVVDVFFQLRETDEPSFGGGEFIVIKLFDDEIADLLKSKGHLISDNKKYACIYWPHHIMGLETPVSILLGDLKGIGTHKECRQHTVMSAIARRDFKKGEQLTVGGHHHSIDDMTPALFSIKDASNLAPFYLLNGATLINDVKEGEAVTLDDIDLSNLKSFEIYQKGLDL